MTLLESLRKKLHAAGDAARAKKQQAYMKSEMPYHGVPAAEVGAICKEVFAPISYAKRQAWERDVRAIWGGAKFREERYCAIALTDVKQARPFQTPDVMPLYEKMIVEGAWWDFVDEIATNRVGPIFRAHPETMRPMMLRWSKDAHMWKARTSILVQCRSRAETDAEFLYACIEPSIASKEFFLRKAIGWALREYAHVDMAAVKRYVKKNEARLSGLSKREALKHA
ncbi:MAG TPA: DNA alkylation repair protein [Polyangiaceae bacterium]|jgi:3-methyladenine DNA glycosylase AlkD